MTSRVVARRARAGRQDRRCELRCKCGNIVVIDFQKHQIAYAKARNFDPNSIENHFEAVMQFWQTTKNFMLTGPMDEAYAATRFDRAPYLERILAAASSQ